MGIGLSRIGLRLIYILLGLLIGGTGGLYIGAKHLGEDNNITIEKAKSKRGEFILDIKQSREKRIGTNIRDDCNCDCKRCCGRRKKRRK